MPFSTIPQVDKLRAKEAKTSSVNYSREEEFKVIRVPFPHTGLLTRFTDSQKTIKGAR